jgi:uncharacterized membrane protein
MVWLGGGVMLSVIGLRVRRSDDLAAIAEFARALSFVGLRVFLPAVLVVLATGLWMVVGGSAWRVDQLWILLALAAFVVAFLVGAVYLSRSASSLRRAAIDDADTDSARRALGRWLAGYAVVLAILLFAVWDMVFKPGL